jgi:hypothetical protein
VELSKSVNMRIVVELLCVRLVLIDHSTATANARAIFSSSE